MSTNFVVFCSSPFLKSDKCSDNENAFDRNIFFTEMNEETSKNSNCFIIFKVFCNNNHRKYTFLLFQSLIIFN